MSIHKVTFVLLIVGGLNWLLVGLVGWDISRFLGGESSMLSRAVYILVGLAAVYEIVSHKEYCKACESKTPIA
ncbi:MAG: DUF378 domain-containing protein [Candidatus Moranbacteria bacterium]|nr:DUF378 domain-containing protein [Candidatus Moranbacteria bacterium]